MSKRRKRRPVTRTIRLHSQQPTECCTTYRPHGCWDCQTLAAADSFGGVAQLLSYCHPHPQWPIDENTSAALPPRRDGILGCLIAAEQIMR